MQDHPGAPGSARQRNPGTDGTRVRWRGRALAPGVGPRPVPRRALAHALGAGPCPVRCRVHALGAEPPSVRCRVHGVARPRWLWPGERRPEYAADHRPLAGSREPAAPGSLAPRPCHSPRSHLSAIPLHHPSSASRHTGADPPAACHRGHGLPTPTLLARPAPTRTPTTYSRRLWSPRSAGNVDSRARGNDGRRTPPLHMVERGPGGEAQQRLTCRPCRQS